MLSCAWRGACDDANLMAGKLDNTTPPEGVLLRIGTGIGIYCSCLAGISGYRIMYSNLLP